MEKPQELSEKNCPREVPRDCKKEKNTLKKENVTHKSAQKSVFPKKK